MATVAPEPQLCPRGQLAKQKARLQERRGGLILRGAHLTRASSLPGAPVRPRTVHEVQGRPPPCPQHAWQPEFQQFSQTRAPVLSNRTFPLPGLGLVQLLAQAACS